jgi:hypothetical protein
MRLPFREILLIRDAPISIVAVWDMQFAALRLYFDGASSLMASLCVCASHPARQALIGQNA